MQALQIATVMLLSFIGGLVQSLTGFGYAIIALMGLQFFYDPLTAPSISSSIALGLTVLLAFRLRKHLRFRIWAPYTLLFIIVSNLTILVADRFNMKAVSIGFGVFLIAISLFYLSDRKPRRVGHASAAVFLILSAFFSGLFGIGGPLASIVLLDRTDTKEEYIANFQMILCLNSIASVATRIYKGFYTASLIPITILGIIAVSIGKSAAMRIMDRIDINAMKRIVYIGIGIAGLITVVQKAAFT